jgi:hypothetical protein
MAIIALYLYFVNIAGPRFMKDRKPYQMKVTLIVYNFLQVLVSVYIFVEVRTIYDTAACTFEVWWNFIFIIK